VADPTTLAGVLAGYERAGFTSQFAAREGGELECLTCHHRLDPAITELDHFRRLEGTSDPDEMMAVLALTCPRCRARGTVALSYGPEASAEDAELLARLPAPPPPDPLEGS
jgi:hypothetical protein